MPNYPVEIHQMFSHLPDKIDRIDAAYERPYDNGLVFISGKLKDMSHNFLFWGEKP